MHTEEVMKKRSKKMKGEEQEEYDRKRYIRAVGDAMETFMDIMEEPKDG